MRPFFILLSLLGAFCGRPPGTATPPPPPPPAPPAAVAPKEVAPTEKAVLLFDIGVHIEPLGATPSPLVPNAVARQGQRRQPDYHRPPFFDRQVDDLRAVASLVESHGGHLTIQGQTPFTSVAIERKNTVLADLAARGHEIGMHFHEEVHLGTGSSALSPQTWCSVYKEELGYLKKASGVQHIRYWSGGNLYPHNYEAALCAGFDVNSGFKNPRTQQTPTVLIGVTPWRPAGGTDGVDFGAFKTDDPNGKIVFLPDGMLRDAGMGAEDRADGGEDAYFELLKQSFLDSIKASTPGKVNVAQFTIHVGEFKGQDPDHPFASLEKFLKEVVDPHVATGEVKWATYSQMADAFRAQGTTSLPQTVAPQNLAVPVAPPGNVPDKPRISFIINVHDWVHHDESARTILKLVDLFEKNGVRGDFYLTAEVTRIYAEKHPEVLERLKSSNMGISYHIRPPHPLYVGFEQRLDGLDEATLRQTLLDYETYKLDMTNGELDRTQPGGYRYVAQMLGKNPVVAAMPAKQALRAAASSVYLSLGAKMTLDEHEGGTDISLPYEMKNGMLLRPSDLGVTRTTAVDGSRNFWWNCVSRPDAARYLPVTILKNALSQWVSEKKPRQPFVTAIIHENNFVRSGPEGWTQYYYQMDGKQKGEALLPPYHMNAPDASELRSETNQAQIWSAYEEMVRYAAANLLVVTGSDIVGMSGIP